MVLTVQIDVLYPSRLSFTVTRTKATRELSGEICGSPIQVKLNKSFSVMLRCWANAGATRTARLRARADRNALMEMSFRAMITYFANQVELRLLFLRRCNLFRASE